jgi:formylglycine-generating enzyme required for sulfatase activity
MQTHSWIPLVAILTVFGSSSVFADEKRQIDEVVPYEKLRNPGEIREIEIVTGVRMKFSWIPPGKATLGAPEFEKKKCPRDEVEHEYTSKGYWLGKCAVTQAEWQAMMGDNPSWFSKDGGGKEKVAGLETGRFPVEQVSWQDCARFLGKLNDRGGAANGFGKRGGFVLPHEYEWEYACRGGLGNRLAFYFGGALNGKQANCCGTVPFGTETKGPHMERTTAVGAYENVAPHPWGLCDMHGNVWQWCENWGDHDRAYRACRGGCWDGIPWDCRAAFRYGQEPALRHRYFGFRVCFRPD